MKYLHFYRVISTHSNYKLSIYTKIIVFLFLLSFAQSFAQTPAFPGAAGFGKYTTGGRGGDVYKVTNLNDSGPGSFREACNSAGSRTIIFEVSGNINLNSDIIVTNDNLTIAGQTAPGDGICIKNASFIVQASNVMVRHIRFRLGDNGYKDASGNIIGSDSEDKDVIRILGKPGGTSDVIFDHCSMSWSIDEIVEIYGSTNVTDGVNDVTFQYCIFSEGLYNSHHSSGENSEGFKMSENSDNITLYKNLFSSNWEHNIRSEGGCSFEMINNIVYNMRKTTAIGTANQFALINSYFKKGEPFLLSEYMADYYTAPGYLASQTQAYVSGNTSDYSGLTQLDGALVPFEQATPPLDSGISPDTMANAINDILENSGAILPIRDAVDNRIINGYNATTSAIIDTQEEVGGFPTLNSTSALLDTDSDGMPDSWEISNGLDINNPADRNFLNGEGYTNLELYLNGFNVSFSAGSDLTICEGETAVLTASGGTNFSWNTGENTASITVNPTVTTTYAVSGLDQNSNTVSDDVTIYVNPLPIANAGVNVTICQGETVTLNASGGDSYMWNTGQTTANISVSPNSTTTYTVIVTQNGCSDTDNVQVIVNPLPTANAGADVTINNGDSTTLTASGGDAYLWNTGETTASITVSPTSITTYTVTVTQNNCASTDEVIVTVNTATVVANAGEDQTICAGDSATLTAFGGTDYLWSTGETTPSITVNPNTDTSYSVTVSEGGNSDSDEVSVFVNPLPTANAGTDITINNGDSTTLTASGGDAYLWNTGGTTASIIVSPTSTTTYIVTVTQNNCASTDEVIVTVNTATVVANAGEDQTICAGDSATLTAFGGTDYLWSTGETTPSITVNPNMDTSYSVTVSEGGNSDFDEVSVFVNPLPNVQVSGDSTILQGDYITLSASGANIYEWSNGATQPNIAVNPNTTTTYAVKGFINNCFEEKEVTINVIEQVIAYAGEDATICSGESITLTASGGETYLWSTGETTQNIDVSPLEDTTYEVIVSNSLDEDLAEIIVFVDACEVEEEIEVSEDYEMKIYSDQGNSSILNIKIQGLINTSSFYIHNVNGKLMYYKNVDSNNGQQFMIKLNTSIYNQGVYFLTLKENNIERTKRVVFR